MAESELLAALTQGQPVRAVRLAAARALLPLPRRDLLSALIHLSGDPDPEVAEAARSTLHSQPVPELRVELKSPECRPAVLEYFTKPGTPAELLEAVILNPSAPGTAVAQIAAHASAPLLEVVLYNRVRILECPAILERLRANPEATADVLRVAAEIEQEFLGTKKQQYEVSPEEPSAEEENSEAAVIEEDVLLDELVLEGLPVDPEAREKALTERLAGMTVNQKTRYAMMGPREARAVLIRDTNREVARAVLKSPKLTENEVESFAAMRSVSVDVLREIGSSREWTRNYNTVHALVKNPKTPPAISQRIMFRLTTRDLSNLVRDRGVPELVRRSAQQTLAQRSAGRSRV